MHARTSGPEFAAKAERGKAALMSPNTEVYGGQGVVNMSSTAIKESTRFARNQKPEYLIVTAFPGSHLDIVRKALAQTGQPLQALPSTGQNLPDGHSMAPTLLDASGAAQKDATTEWLSYDPAIHCLCITEGPVAAIATALKAGRSLEEAAAEWQHNAEAALDLIRRNRFQCLTLLQEQIAPEQKSFTQLIQDRFGIELDLEVDSGQQSAEDAFYSILAAQYVTQNMELADIAAELEASAWPLSDNPMSSKFNYDAVVEAYRDGLHRLEGYRQQSDELESLRSESEQLKVRHADLQQENDTMLSQLHKVQLELEDYFLRYEEEKKKSAELTKGRERFKNELKQLKKAQQKAENDVANMQQGIDGRNNTIRQKVRTIKNLEMRIDAIEKSRSWRLTKPGRAIGRLLRSAVRRR